MNKVPSDEQLAQNNLAYSVIHEYETKKEKAPIKGNLLRRKESRFWVPDDTVTNCSDCGAEFNMWIRRHHCRRCLDVFCWECTPHRRVIPKSLRGETPTTLNETVTRTIDKMMDSLETSWSGFISDAGMSGPVDSIIGMQKEPILKRFLEKRPARMMVAEGVAALNAVLFCIDSQTGRCQSVERVRRFDGAAR